MLKIVFTRIVSHRFSAKPARPTNAINLSRNTDQNRGISWFDERSQFPRTAKMEAYDEKTCFEEKSRKKRKFYPCPFLYIFLPSKLVHNRYGEKAGSVFYNWRDTGYMILGKRDT